MKARPVDSRQTQAELAAVLPGHAIAIPKPRNDISALSGRTRQRLAHFYRHVMISVELSVHEKDLNDVSDLVVCKPANQLGLHISAA